MTWQPLTSFGPQHLDALSIGAGILGTGGGGSPHLSRMYADLLFANAPEVPVVAIADLPDDAAVISNGGVGAPTVGVERIKEGHELLRAMRALEKHTGKTVTHTIAAEIGGGNSISPLILSIQAGIPIVDGDAMGRAFPEIQMDTFCIYGVRPTPCAISDIRGHIGVFDHIDDARDLERYVRQVTVQMGGGAGMAGPILTAEEARRTAIPGTLSFAVHLGQAVLDARYLHEDPIVAATEVSGGQLLFAGKITDVDRRFVAGFARGRLTLDGADSFNGRNLIIDFQNENLVAIDDEGAVLCSVPDLICIVDAETAEPISTEMLRYGLRVAVLGIPAPRLIATPEALEVVGPAAFGYPEVEYIPLPGTYGGALAAFVDSGLHTAH